MALLIWVVKPDYFEKDLELIRQLKDVATPDHFRFLIDDYLYSHRYGPRALRKLLGLRLSGRRLFALRNSFRAAR